MPLSSLAVTCLREGALTGVFCLLAFGGGLAAASTTILNGAHGNIRSWDALMESLRAVIPSSHVLVSRRSGQVVLMPIVGNRELLPETTQAQLLELAHFLRKIENVKAIIFYIRQWKFIAAMATLAALFAGVISIVPIVFGLPPLSSIPLTFTMGALFLSVVISFLVSHYCASTFSQVHDHIDAVRRSFDGNDLSSI